MFCVTYSTFNMQRSRFASTVSKCQGFCQGISPFYSICLGDKIAEAVKFLEIKKKSFPRTKKEFFCKRKKDFFHKKNFFTRQIIHVHLYSLFIPSFCIFLTHYSSVLNRSSFPETLLSYALNEVTDVMHFFGSK